MRCEFVESLSAMTVYSWVFFLDKSEKAGIIALIAEARYWFKRKSR